LAWLRGGDHGGTTAIFSRWPPKKSVTATVRLMTFIATANAVRLADTVLVDVDPDASMTRMSQVVIASHKSDRAGARKRRSQPAAISAIARTHRLAVVETRRSAPVERRWTNTRHHRHRRLSLVFAQQDDYHRTGRWLPTTRRSVAPAGAEEIRPSSARHGGNDLHPTLGFNFVDERLLPSVSRRPKRSKRASRA
jgi:hypothetical protein